MKINAWKLLCGVALAALIPASAHADEEPDAIRDAGDSVRGIEVVRSFTMTTPMTYTWRKERPEMTDGLVLQLRVDPQMVIPRQIDVPVLYVGDTPAAMTNWDHQTGCAVVYVPGSPNLATTPIFFGSTELPEDVDAARGAKELADARALGIGPMPADAIESARAVGGPTLVASDFRDVHAYTTELVAACTAPPK